VSSYFKPFDTSNELLSRHKDKMLKEDAVGPVYLISSDGKRGKN